MIGIKLYRKPVEAEAREGLWRSMGIDTLFFGGEAAEEAAWITGLQERGWVVYLIFPVFYAPDLLEKHPEWAAITAEGKPAREDWVEWGCPGNSRWIESRLKTMRDWLERSSPDGITLDFIRHFVFWEMRGEDVLPPVEKTTCFCPFCTSAFARERGVSVPEGSSEQQARWILEKVPELWFSWRTKEISRTVDLFLEAARRVQPDIRTAVHTVPWLAGELEEAQRKIAAQDLRTLSASADFVFPMAYFHMLKKSPEWCREVIQDQARYKRTIPSLQVGSCYREEPISEEAFSLALQNCLQEPSGGVVFWNDEMLAMSPEKQQIIRNICGTLGSSGSRSFSNA